MRQRRSEHFASRAHGQPATLSDRSAEQDFDQLDLLDPPRATVTCKYLACGKDAKEGLDVCGDHVPPPPEYYEWLRTSWGFAGGTSDNERRAGRADFQQTPLVTVARVAGESWMGRLRVEELERVHPGEACAGCEKCRPRR